MYIIIMMSHVPQRKVTVKIDHERLKNLNKPIKAASSSERPRVLSCSV